MPRVSLVQSGGHFWAHLAAGPAEHLYRGIRRNAAHPHLGQAGCVERRPNAVAQRDDERELRLRRATGHEHQSIRGAGVEPVSVVHYGQDGTALARLGEKGRHGHVGSEAIPGAIIRRQTERGSQSTPLRGRKALDVIRHRGQQLRQAGVRQLDSVSRPRALSTVSRLARSRA